MLYLSKGLLINQCRGAITINRCGRIHELQNEQARDWLAWHTGVQYLGKARLAALEKVGLVESQPGKEFTSEVFRILVNCVIAPRQRKLPYWGLEPDERRLLRWIREAGLRLTAAELVKLAEAGIEPKAQYLGAENRQRVVELIYTKENIFDGALEAAMELSPALPGAVSILLSLLKKRRIILI